MGVLAVMLVGGFFIDLWAHSHGRVDDTFFTPWHGILYTGAFLHGVVLMGVALQGRKQGLGLRQSLPSGYGLSLVGAALFLVAGVFDLSWHEVFGFEDGTEALLSPSHLLLATSGIFMVAGPVRSAWVNGVPKTFPRWLPWVFALTMLLSIITSFTEYAHPAIDTWPASTPPSGAQQSSLLVVDAEGVTQTRVALSVGENIWLPDFFPNGNRIAVSASDGETGGIYILDTETWEARLLWEGVGAFNHAEVSPDGGRVAFTAQGPNESAEIFVIDVDGGEPTQLTNNDAVDWGPTWSSDGASILFVSNRDGDGDLYTIPATGGDPVQLINLEGDQGAPAWSPDGSRIAFDSNTDGDTDLYVMDSDGSNMTALTVNNETDSGPAWSPDGESIAFASDRDGNFELFRTDLESGETANLTRNPGAHDSWGGIAWSADGSMIATNTSGWVDGFNEPFFREALGVASILVQAALIAGFLLLMLSRGPLPLGAITMILTVNAALMTVISDYYWYIAPALMAGILGDLLAWGTRDSDPVRQARLLATGVPAIWYGGYLVAVAVTQDGLGWSIHMILGAPVIAGIVGMLLSVLVFPPHRPVPVA
jgi:Tol biopolymer transport system component